MTQFVKEGPPPHFLATCSLCVCVCVCVQGDAEKGQHTTAPNIEQLPQPEKKERLP